MNEPCGGFLCLSCRPPYAAGGLVCLRLPCSESDIGFGFSRYPRGIRYDLLCRMPLLAVVLLHIFTLLSSAPRTHPLAVPGTASGLFLPFSGRCDSLKNRRYGVVVLTTISPYLLSIIRLRFFRLAGDRIDAAPRAAPLGIQLPLLFLRELFVWDILLHNHTSFGVLYITILRTE